MSSSARLRANRLNALRSTGPRTNLGKRRSALNALTTGLFARSLVIDALGETVEDLESFRRSVRADLAPIGTVEGELTDRVAGLLRRLRRVARHEAAAMATSIGPLPPAPETISGAGIDDTLPLSPRASVGDRLARVRSQLRYFAARIDDLRAAAEVLACAATEPGSAVDTRVVGLVLHAADDVVGWMLVPAPWPTVFTAAGCSGSSVTSIVWTGRGLVRVLRTAASRTGRDPDGFVSAVGVRLAELLAEAEHRLAALETEEAELVERLIDERSRAAATRVFADDSLVARVARAEAHLTRELERALAVLERLRAGRGNRVPGELGSFCE